MAYQGKVRQAADDRAFDIIVNVTVILITLLAIYPLYFVILASISDPYATASGKTLLMPVKPTLEGYNHILHYRKIWTGYGNTIIYTLGSALVGVSVTTLAGYSLSRQDLVGRNFFMKLFVFTMYFSGGIVPLYLVMKGLTLINTRMVVILLGGFSAYNLVVARTFFVSKLPTELYEAASVDGCGNGRFFFRIVLPLSKEIVTVLVLYYAVSQWNSYFNAMIYTTKPALQPLQLVLRDILINAQTMTTDGLTAEELAEQQRLAETTKYGVMVVSSLPVLVAYPFLQKFFINGVMIGSVKG